MRFSKDHKAQTRARIVEKAAAMFRRDGLESVSVPALMKEAGLTHGGFYAHFASKDALVAEAVEAALNATRAHWSEAAAGASDPLAAVIDSYVSAEHRDHPEFGCAVAAIGPETARGAPEPRRAMSEGARRAIDAVAAAWPGRDVTAAEDDAIGLLTAMVGALVVSRACKDDAAFSDRVLAVCRERLKRAVATGS